LAEDPSTISESIKVKFLRDIHLRDRNVVFNIWSLLKNENSSLVWQEAAKSISIITSELFDSSIFPRYKNFLTSLFKRHLDRLGFAEINDEPINDKKLRKTLFAVASTVNYEEYLQFELERLKKFLQSIYSKYGSNYNYNLCESLKLADASIHAEVIAKMLNKQDDVFARSTKTDDLKALTCSLDRQILINLLQLALNRTNVLDDNERQTVFDASLSQNFGLQITLDFVLEHFDFSKDSL
jgi:ERAP1-like C-terminal domain